MAIQSDAVWMLARSEMRQRRGSLVAILVMLTVVYAIVASSVAGAARTASVLDRFLEATNSPDLAVGVAWPPLVNDLAAVEALADEVRAAPGVDSVSTAIGVIGGVGTQRDFVMITSVDGSHLVVGGPRPVSGRLPDDSAAEELAISESVADELGLGVGDRVDVATILPATLAAVVEGEAPFAFDGPPLSMLVVGVVRNLAGLGSNSESNSPVGYASTALLEAAENFGIGVAVARITGDSDVLDDVEIAALVRRIVPPRADVFTNAGADATITRAAYRSLAVGLLLFAAVASVAGLLAIALAVVRHLQQARLGSRAADALGVVRRQLIVAWSLPIVIAAALAAVLGAVIAVMTSPLFPMSIARRAEVDPGVRLEALPVFAATALVFVATAVITVSAAARQVRRARAVRPDPRRAGAGSRWAAVGALRSPAASVGLSALVGRRGSRSTTSPATAVVGAVLSVAAVVAIAVFLGSQHDTATDRSRFGVLWDREPDVFSEDPDGLVARLVADDRLSSVAGLFCTDGPVLDVEGPLCAMRIAKGGVLPVMLAGRGPASPDEIALGSVTAAANGVAVGDDVEISTAGGTRTMRVVGVAVIPTVDPDNPGNGAMVTEQGLLTAADVSDIYDVATRQLLLGYPSGADVALLDAALTRDHPELTFSSYAEPGVPDLVTQLGRLRPMLVVLAAFIALLGAAGLLHYLWMSVRGRRSETAVLQSLGFVPRQVRSVVTWQAVSVVVIGVALGVPAGVVVGRWVWGQVIGDLGIVDSPITPWLAMLAVAVVSGLLAAALSWWPGRRSLAVSPALALRGE